VGAEIWTIYDGNQLLPSKPRLPGRTGFSRLRNPSTFNLHSIESNYVHCKKD
jgi:hypothetical protein